MNEQSINNLLGMSHTLSEFVVGFEGNVSARTPDGFWIKSSGKSLATLEKEDLALCGKIQNNITPSIESIFHELLYRENHSINFIAHTHPVNLLKILCNKSKTYRFANSRYFPDQVIFNGRSSCVVEYAKPGQPLSVAIKLALDSFGKFPDVFLLLNHGLICCGITHTECIIKTQICEKSAIIWDDSGDELTNSDIEDLLQDDKEKYRRMKTYDN